MIDLSTGGVAFDCYDEFAAGETLFITLQADSGHGPSIPLQRLARAHVLRSVRAVNGSWTVVCRFEHPLTFEEVHRIGSHLFAATFV